VIPLAIHKNNRRYTFMEPIEHTELINIVMDWTRNNEQEITQGTKIASPMEMLAFERNLLLLLMQLGAIMMVWVIKARVEDKDFQRTAANTIIPRKAEKYKHQSNQMTSVTTLFGNTLRPRTRFYVRRRDGRRACRKNGSGVYPALEMLGIKNGVTPALSSEIAREVTEGPSMDAAQKRMARRGMEFDIKFIKRISEAFANTGLAIREEWSKMAGRVSTFLIPAGESLKGMRVMIGVDGGRLKTRANKRGKIPEGNKRHGYKTDWREPKMLVIRAIDDMGKVIREELPIYDGTLGDADALFGLLEAHLRAREICLAEEVICMSDGAEWIWNRMEGLLMSLNVDPSRINFGIDYYHAVEHLTSVADGKRDWTQKKRTRWLNKMKGLLNSGDIEGIIGELSVFARGRNARVAKREMNYFEKHKERMRYNRFKEQNLPIGSGPTESAIRQVINLRLKGTGMFWLEENAEGFLHLRCYLKSGRWEYMEHAVITHLMGAV
jgi:hypothetical protein